MKLWDFWTRKIYNMPEDTILFSKRLYLGDAGEQQAVLAFKDGEFRIYTYDYNNDDESSEDNGRANLYYEFEDFVGSYYMDSFGYVVLESDDEAELIDMIIKSCEANLDYFPPFAMHEIPNFIKRRVGEANKYNKVYVYYK